MMTFSQGTRNHVFGGQQQNPSLPELMANVAMLQKQLENRQILFNPQRNQFVHDYMQQDPGEDTSNPASQVSHRNYQNGSQGGAPLSSVPS